jgi:mersacidin/lichenicidin family type 2 lantibiotic
MTPQNMNIIAAWKKRQFRIGLNPEQLAQLPQNPAGAVELSDEEVKTAVGAVPKFSVPIRYCGPFDRVP